MYNPTNAIVMMMDMQTPMQQMENTIPSMSLSICHLLHPAQKAPIVDMHASSPAPEPNDSVLKVFDKLPNLLNVPILLAVVKAYVVLIEMLSHG